MLGSHFYEKVNDVDKIQFSVFTDEHGTSQNIQKAIWLGQHTCVTDRPEFYMHGQSTAHTNLSTSECGEAVIKNQLNFEHFSVLNAAFISFHCYGFPHSVVQQVTRHRDSSFLVTSMRYTGEKFIQVAKNMIPVEDAFYIRGQNVYADRNGNKCLWTDKHRNDEITKCLKACYSYKENIENKNMPYEMAREFLPFCYRQPFSMFCTIEGLFHMLDQRTKADSEREIRILADLLFQEFQKKAPELGAWYQNKRYGKARLAP